MVNYQERVRSKGEIMNKLQCKNKKMLSCYLQQNWFFLSASILFIVLLIISFIGASYYQVSRQDKMIATYITSRYTFCKN